MWRDRRWSHTHWRRISAAAFGIFVLGVAVYLMRTDGTGLSRADQLASIGSLLLALPSLGVSFLAFRLSQRGTAATGEADRLQAPATFLANAMRVQWNNEADARQLRHPRPLQLYWKQEEGTTGMSGSLLEQGGEDGEPGARLIANFNRLRSRQLVILGEPGAGKSTVALLFTVTALGRPGASPATHGAVPVYISAAGWRPETESVAQFVVRHLNEVYPDLPNRYGDGIAHELVHAGRVLPVLDGLDELGKLLPAAMSRLWREAGAGHLPMLVTCRRAEYDEATQDAGHPPLAAEVTIAPIKVKDTITYLTEGPAEGAQRWRQVVARLRTEPRGPLATALSTPLMASLAREVYQPGGTDPGELTRLPSAEAVEDHLLSRFLPSLYPGADRPARTFRFLARHLQTSGEEPTPDYEWWRLDRTVPRAVVGLFVMALVMIGGLAACIALRPITDLDKDQTLTRDLLTNIEFGAVLSATVAVVAALNATRTGRQQPGDGEQPADDGPQPTGGGRSHLLTVTAAALRDGLAASIVLTIGMYLFLRSTINEFDWQVAISFLEIAAFGGAVGTALGLIANGLRRRENRPVRPSLRLSGLFPALLSGFGFGLLLGLPIGAVAGIFEAISKAQPAEGVRSGVIIALVVGAAIGTPLGVGRWLGSPAERHDPPSPRGALRGDILTLLATATSAGISGGLGAAAIHEFGGILRLGGLIPASTLEAGFWGGLIVFGITFCGYGAPSVGYAASVAWLWATGRVPLGLMRFMEDARGRGVLRQVGPVYQFRHLILQDHLAGERTARLPDPARRRKIAALRKRMAIATTTAAAVVLPTVVGVVAVPNARNILENQVNSQRRAEAQAMRQAADRLQAGDPRSALRLRIAAAEADAQSSMAELSYFVFAYKFNAVGWTVRTSNWRRLGDYAVMADAEKRSTAHSFTDPAKAPIDLGSNLVSHGSNATGGSGVVSGAGASTREWNFDFDPPRSRVLAADGFEVAYMTGSWLILKGTDDHTSVLNMNEQNPVPRSLQASVTGLDIYGDRLLRGETESGTVIWDLSGSAPQVLLRGPDLGRIVVDGKGRRALIDIGDGFLRLTDLSRPALSWQDLGSGASAFDIDASGSWVFARFEGGVTRLWRLAADGRVGEPFTIDAVRSGTAYFSDNGRWLVARDGDGRPLLWDLATGVPRLQRLPGQPSAITLGSDEVLAALHEGANITIVRLADVSRPMGSVTVDASDDWQIENVDLDDRNGLLLVESARYDDAGELEEARSAIWDVRNGAPQPLAFTGLGDFELLPDGSWIESSGPLPITVHDRSGLRRAIGVGPAHVNLLMDKAMAHILVVYDVPDGYLLSAVDLRKAPSSAQGLFDARAEACYLVFQEGLSQQEWQRHLPDVPYRRICTNAPLRRS